MLQGHEATAKYVSMSAAVTSDMKWFLLMMRSSLSRTVSIGDAQWHERWRDEGGAAAGDLSHAMFSSFQMMMGRLRARA